MRKTSRTNQRGSFALGLIVGLLIGLTLALGVALYVSKVPVPFVDKVPQRTAEQDAAEAERNRNWDPNAALPGKGASQVPGSSAATPAPLLPGAAPGPARAASAMAPAAPTAPPIAAFGGSAPEAAVARSAKPPSQAFQYFVQVGAFSHQEEAEQQRARLAINGMIGRISEREQAGHTMYRVRLGPFDQREEADRAKEQAAGAGFSDAALVRVAR